jgi:hypothetical protein
MSPCECEGSYKCYYCNSKAILERAAIDTLELNLSRDEFKDRHKYREIWGFLRGLIKRHDDYMTEEGNPCNEGDGNDALDFIAHIDKYLGIKES